eukprot:Hpha_TRINITY_DN15770_c6_g4::TRINITY_DN15770_c6_g4_i1::g.41365::m.41365
MSSMRSGSQPRSSSQPHPQQGLGGAVKALASAIAELDSTTRALCAGVAAAAESNVASGREPERLEVHEWAVNVLVLPLRWLSAAASLDDELAPGAYWLMDPRVGAGPPRCTECAGRLSVCVHTLAQELKAVLWPLETQDTARSRSSLTMPNEKPPLSSHRLSDSGSSLQRSQSHSSHTSKGKPPQPSTIGASRRSRSSRQKPRPTPELRAPAAMEAFRERRTALTGLCGDVVRMLAPLRRQHLRRLRELRRELCALDASGGPVPAPTKPLPVPAVWEEPPHAPPAYPQLQWPVMCPLEPLEVLDPDFAGLKVAVWAQVGSESAEMSDNSQWEDFTARVHIAAGTGGPRMYTRMKLVVTSLELTRLTSVRTSFGEERMQWNEASPGSTVRLVPSARGGGGTYLATVLARDENTVKLRWHEPNRGGPTDDALGAELGCVANREMTESRGWWEGDGRARKVRERFVAPWAEKGGSVGADYAGLELELPNLGSGNTRDVLVLGQVRCVGLTELVFHIGARPWEAEDKRRLRFNVAHAIGEDPSELRFADMSDVDEDGCITVHAAFPSHRHPRIVQRRLLCLAEESAEDSGLFVPLASARPAQPRHADVRVAVQFRFSDSTDELSRSVSDSSLQPPTAANSYRSDGTQGTPRPRVVFDTARDVAHTATAELRVAERGGMASGRVREEVFRQNLCTILGGRGYCSATSDDRKKLLLDLLRILSAHMYDHPISELRETKLFRELLYAAVEGEVALNDAHEWNALLRSLREQRHVINAQPLDPHPMRRHWIYKNRGGTVAQVHNAVVRLHSEVTRLEYLETEAENQATQAEVQGTVEEEETEGRRMVDSEEARCRSTLSHQARRLLKGGSVSPQPARVAHTPPRRVTRQASGSVPRLPLSDRVGHGHGHGHAVASPQARIPHSEDRRPPSGQHRSRTGKPPSPSVSPSAVSSTPISTRSGRLSGSQPLKRQSSRSRSKTRGSDPAPSRPGKARSRSRTSGDTPLVTRAGSATPTPESARRTRHVDAAADFIMSHSQGANHSSSHRRSVTPSNPSQQRLSKGGSKPHPSVSPQKRRPGERPVGVGSPPRKERGIRPGTSVQVMCGREAVLSACQASPAGWHDWQARYIGRSGTVIGVDLARGTATLRFAALGLATHDPGHGRATEWPLSVLTIQEDNGDDDSDGQGPTGKHVDGHGPNLATRLSEVPTSIRPLHIGGTSNRRRPPPTRHRPEPRSSASNATPVQGRARGARLGAIYGAPVAVMAVLGIVATTKKTNHVNSHHTYSPKGSPPRTATPPEFDRGCPSPASDLSSVTSIHFAQQGAPEAEMLQ